MPQAPHSIELDVAIIGGGVAGLWLANRLSRAGFDTALFESRALGSDQTVASQGMIHGGLKYSLGGQVTGATRAIANMPNRWRACLTGRGELDLRQTPVLSDCFYLWSGAGLGAGLQALLASRALRGRSRKLSPPQHPPPLNHPDFRGQVYQLDDLVLDVPGLVANLAANIPGRLLHTPAGSATLNLEGGRVYLTLASREGTVRVSARRFVFTAGRGNAALLEQLGLSRPAMQTRPLRQAVVRHPALVPFYGHCLGRGTRPRLTLSSHADARGGQVWYLGGQLAEYGAEQTSAQLIARAQSELHQLLPWLNLDGARWSSLAIDRAEPAQREGKRPEGACLLPVPGADNLLVGWPTKLTLAPQLADLGLDELARAGIAPSGGDGAAALSRHLPPPPLAPLPWNNAPRNNTSATEEAP